MMIGRGRRIGFGRGFYGWFETQPGPFIGNEERGSPGLCGMLWNGSEGENRLGRKGWYDGLLALGCWARTLCLSTTLASIVFNLFAVFLVCALASVRPDIPRAEEGIDGVVLGLVFDHGQAQIADEGCPGTIREEGAGECAGWGEGQAGCVGL
jgi:hypothetical protein